MNTRKQLGILYILGAAIGFAFMGLFVRLSGDLPTFQKVFFRNCIATICSFALLYKNRKSFKITKENYLPMFLRAFFGTAGLMLHFYSIDHMNIADANMLNKLSPFFAMIVSYFILKEAVQFFDWIAIVVAFIGALFVVKPSFHFSVLYSITASAGGLCAGIAYTYVRVLGKKGIDSNLIIFYFSAFSTIATLPLFLLHYQTILWWQLYMLLGAGIFAMLGQFCITKAYLYAPAKEIGVFDYTQVMFSAILGYIFLGQFSDIWSYIGYILIIGMAVVKWWRDQENGVFRAETKNI